MNHDETTQIRNSAPTVRTPGASRNGRPPSLTGLMEWSFRAPSRKGERYHRSGDDVSPSSSCRRRHSNRPLLATIPSMSDRGSTPTSFDVIVIGGGPGGERAAIQAAKSGRRVALVERANVVGGTSVNWGTIPSKTLRESALFVHGLMRHRLHGFQAELTDEVTVADFMYRERLVVQRELELIGASLGRYRVEVFHGHGRFLDPHTIEVVGRDGRRKHVLGGDVIVIATGSRPSRPADVPFDGNTVFDSDSILKLPRIPKTMIVLGAGVIGIEYASIFAALGVYVTLVDTRDRLLPYVDREIVSILERELGNLHVAISHDDRYERIERIPANPPRIRCVTRKGQELQADVLLYAVGRDGNTKGLN